MERFDIDAITRPASKTVSWGQILIYPGKHSKCQNWIKAL